MTIPNFRGRRALVLHRGDRNQAAIAEQLEKLGLQVWVRWPAENVPAGETDVMFFDSDLGFDGLFAWTGSPPPLPLIAVLGSEAPGRIEWTLAQEPAAYLWKPVGSTGVFTALSIAFHNFALREAREAERRRLEARLERQTSVIRATVMVMTRHGVDAEEALRLLRHESMRRRLPLETVGDLILAGKWLPPASNRKPTHPALIARMSGGRSTG
jgi:AmiR/NasT family two-component response regulator